MNSCYYQFTSKGRVQHKRQACTRCYPNTQQLTKTKLNKLNTKPTNKYKITITLLLLLLLLYIKLAQVTYNQVQPLRINYLASSHRGIKALIVSSIKIV